MLACCEGDDSQQPMCPHAAQRRKCSHHPPAARQSTQPSPLGSALGSIGGISGTVLSRKSWWPAAGHGHTTVSAGHDRASVASGFRPNQILLSSCARQQHTSDVIYVSPYIPLQECTNFRFPLEQICWAGEGHNLVSLEGCSSLASRVDDVCVCDASSASENCGSVPPNGGRIRRYGE